MRPEQRPAVERVERIRHRPTGELSTRNPRRLEGSRVLKPVATEAPGRHRKPCPRRGFTYVRILVEKRSLLIGGEGLGTAAKGESPR